MEEQLSSKEILGQDLKREMLEAEAAFNQLYDDLEMEGAYIAEDVFVSRWLKGLVQRNEKDNVPVVNAWVATIAKTPFVPVHIVRDGKVVNTFPPILAPIQATRTKYEPIRSIHAVSGTAIEDSAMQPHNGQAILHNYLSEVIPEGSYDTKWFAAWNKLVKDYGMSEYVIGETSEAVADTNVIQRSGSIKAESDDEYEDL